MKASLAFAALLLVGCVGLPEMTSAQLRATNGMAMCAQVTSIYGKGSSIAVNADDMRKGINAKGKTVITCGDASMSIESDVQTQK